MKIFTNRSQLPRGSQLDESIKALLESELKFPDGVIGDDYTVRESQRLRMTFGIELLEFFNLHPKPIEDFPPFEM